MSYAEISRCLARSELSTPIQAVDEGNLSISGADMVEAAVVEDCGFGNSWHGPFESLSHGPDRAGRNPGALSQGVGTHPVPGFWHASALPEQNARLPQLAVSFAFTVLLIQPRQSGLCF